MYSNKENVNILTALLVKHGIRHVVVCPGSRNTPLVHNFGESPALTCHPVTDERSAGFYALGICQALQEMVAVCVTSGTALLNVAPAVAETKYQHLPLVVISADRPQAWIGQLDGQTLQQPGAFGHLARMSVSLPEPTCDEERWYCNRMVNEALLEAQRHGGGPVHINVPLHEPLSEFTCLELPDERIIHRHRAHQFDIPELAEDFCHAQRPMVVFGQTAKDLFKGYDRQEIIGKLSQSAVILCESLSDVMEGGVHLDEALYIIGEDEAYLPDVIIYVGDTVVSKRLKRFLRKAKDAKVYILNEDGELTDVFMNVREIIVTHPAYALERLAQSCISSKTPSFVQLWQTVLGKCADHRYVYLPDYSQMAVVRHFEWLLASRYSSSDCTVHYANSTAIRLANIYARHYVYCNRGVNGIEGSLSAAAGFSLVTSHPVFIVIGDLSFFYDSNALWNERLSGNLRILLLNNGGGGIFHQLPVAQSSPADLSYIAAHHHTTAEGICRSYQVEYLSAHDMEEVESKMPIFLQKESSRPILFEVFTDADEDTRVFKDYYRMNV